jgi:hypothetical protein
LGCECPSTLRFFAVSSYFDRDCIHYCTIWCRCFVHPRLFLSIVRLPSLLLFFSLITLLDPFSPFSQADRNPTIQTCPCANRHPPHRTQALRRQDNPQRSSSDRGIRNMTTVKVRPQLLISNPYAPFPSFIICPITRTDNCRSSPGSPDVLANSRQLDLLPSSPESPTRPPIWRSPLRRQRLHHRILLFLRSV